MPMWRCPHCGTPQAETARCWVCRRSSTACGTCRNFRRSVAAGLGYCGLDRRRQPLVGDEIRACWDGWPAGADPRPEVPLTIGPADATDERARPLEFVEVRDPIEVAGPEAPPFTGPIVPTGDTAWSLWGDPER